MADLEGQPNPRELRERQPACPHPCPRPCHLGECPPCKVLIRRSCHCGSMVPVFECLCYNIISEKEQMTVRSCGGPCHSFFGPIPDSIGSLQQLVFLALNANSFSGPIPPSIGNLSNLSWLDLTENQLNGTIPVSSGSTTGPDMLVKTRHLIFDINKLTGSILWRPCEYLCHVL